MQEQLIRCQSVLAFVMASANLDVSAAAKAVQNGAVAVLEKPCEPGPLIGANGPRSVRPAVARSPLRCPLRRLDGGHVILANLCTSCMIAEGATP